MTTEIPETESPRPCDEDDHKNVFPDFAEDPIEEQVMMTGYAI